MFIHIIAVLRITDVKHFLHLPACRRLIKERAAARLPASSEIIKALLINKSALIMKKYKFLVIIGNVK